MSEETANSTNTETKTSTGTNKPITVSIIDDDPLICQTLAMILAESSDGAIGVLSTATDGAQALEHAKQEHPDVVLMDIDMPGMDGIEATRLMLALTPRPHVLILTALSPSSTVQRAVEAGAEGFVSKTDPAENIVKHIQDVCMGSPQFNTDSQRQLMNDLEKDCFRSRRDEARRLLDSLGKRERKASMLAAEGLSNAEIAKSMFISERTVKAELSSACAKLDVNRVLLGRIVERADL
ncbi:response regulator transcription factor [Bifidobacterium sp. ESL0690]|uniref:response regulator transcription factor n=1 Tax=Bifidobacterium sp. ESL0690 TaxID=2983214 RepID=UPI0023F8B37F|nr:response regulator transcription factor [Bifidobacterium sp. ESL0690]WEV46154.1 response regulator transcription factor [Bifidobacterium sp. ESL0690]